MAWSRMIRDYVSKLARTNPEVSRAAFNTLN